LAGGDLRRVLNLLQSADMAYDSEINEEIIYLTAGAAVPSVIETMYTELLNEDFESAYTKMLKVNHLPHIYTLFIKYVLFLLNHYLLYFRLLLNLVTL
jgi:DNA polymerase III delta prime subunit